MAKFHLKSYNQYEIAEMYNLLYNFLCKKRRSNPGMELCKQCYYKRLCDDTNEVAKQLEEKLQRS